MQRRKIAFIKEKLSGKGGLEKWAARLIPAFAKTCDVTLLTTDLSPFDDASITTVRFPKAGFDKRCRHFLKKHPQEIAFGLDRFSAQTHHRAGNGVHPAFLERRKVTDPKWKVKTFHYNPHHRKILSIEKSGYENAQKIFTNSHMVKKEITRFYDVDPKNIEVIHNGVEWNEMSSDFAKWEKTKTSFAKELHLDLSDHQFLFIGNGYRRKGLDILLHALSRLDRKDVHLSVIGKDKELKKYIAMAKRLGIAGRVSFYGPRGDIRKFYALADTLVIPSHYDPFANVTIEALAMGLFVISSPFNGGSEILTRETGIVIPSLLEIDGVIDSLKTAMTRPKTATSANAIRQSVETFELDDVVGKYVSATL